MLAQQGADSLLVQGVAIAVQQADRDRCYPARLDPCGDLPHAILVQRHQHVTVHRDPFDCAEAVVAGDERLGELQFQIVEVVTTLGPDAQDVLEPVRGDQRGLRTPTLQHGICDDGGRSEDRGNIAAPLLSHIQQLVDALQYSAGRIVGRAEHLVGVHHPGIVEQREIGERAAGVECKFHRDPLDKIHGEKGLGLEAE